jgi:hypothetical protein
MGARSKASQGERVRMWAVPMKRSLEPEIEGVRPFWNERREV